MSEETALEKTEAHPDSLIKFGSQGLILEDLRQVHRYAQYIKAAKMAPSSLDTEGKIVVAIQTGAEVGLSYSQSVKSIAVINGNACMWGQALSALVHSSGKCLYMEDWIEGEGDDRVAFCKGARADNKTVMTRRFSVQDAKDAGLWGSGNWKKYASRRLGMKPITWLMRDLFADVLMGGGVREEVEDYAPQTNPPVKITEDKLLTEAKTVAKEPDEPPVIDAEIEPSPTPEPSEDAQPLENPEPADANDDGMTDEEAEEIKQQEIESNG